MTGKAARSSVAALAVLAAATLVSEPAAAEPSVAEKAAAQQLFDEARDLMARGKYAEACAKFARSEELDPAGGTLLNLAACHETVGSLALAWTEFNDALGVAVRDGRADRESFAREHIAAIDPRLSRVRVMPQDPPPQGLVLSIDAIPLERRLWSVAIPLDPGEHVLVATAPGHEAARVAFSTTQGGNVAVAVPALIPAAGGSAPSPAFETAASDASPEPAASAPGSKRASFLRPLGYGIAAAGAAAAGIGGAFGVRAIIEWRDSNAACPRDVCTTAGAARASSALTAARVADVLIGVGVAGAAAGIVLALLPLPHRGAGRAMLRVECIGRGGGASIEGVF